MYDELDFLCCTRKRYIGAVDMMTGIVDIAFGLMNEGEEGINALWDGWKSGEAHGMWVDVRF